MRHRSGFAVVILLAVSLFPGCGGQRYIHVHIERDGETILQTGYGVSDGLDAAAMWTSLQGESFETVGTAIKPEADDPQKAVLKGKIRIVILHVDKEIARAKVDRLRLIRASGSGDRWKLTPGEVQRTAQAAGL